jgi:DNA-binding transcriptional LysR family regulator
MRVSASGELSFLAQSAAGRGFRQRWGERMTNIPTDLLRTFVLVVELRSFTRAAKAQSMTQPAVSAQIRRLQGLLGVELFDKSAPGVSLTPMGEQVIDSARRLLSVNDHIVQIASPNATAQLVRIGVRKDCMGEELSAMLAAARTRWPNLRFAVQGAGQRRLLRYLEQDEVDIVMALVPDEPEEGAARHHWAEQLVWARGKTTELDLNAPIPLIGYKDRCMCSRIAVTTLARADLASELVFRATNAEALRSAVAAGLGVMLVPRSRIPAGLEAWDDGPLPQPPVVYGGVFVRNDAGDTLEQLADRFAEALRPPDPDAAPRATPRHPAAQDARRSA